MTRSSIELYKNCAIVNRRTAMNYNQYSRSYDRWKNIDFAKNCAMNKNRYERTRRDKEHGED